MRRSASESSVLLVPGWEMHVPPPQAGENDAAAIVMGPVRVEFDEFPQSICAFQS
jgi:hypothetical protein